ncbi:MAG: flagellar basal body-associated FliL family protein [Gammaproteobacteria bacterium]|nr:flagellar basal body-associated FliL family protein [Gammaproteobacteria bacterium]
MADEKDITGDQPAAGGKKKLIVILAVVVLLVLGAGGAAFFLVGGDEPDSAEGEQGEAPVVAVEEGEPMYHKFDPEFVVSLPPGGPVGMLQIAIEVMTRTPSVLQTLEVNDPMLRHHMLNLLEDQQAADLMTLEGKQRLRDAIGELLGEKLKELGEPGTIKGVYFTQLVMQ